jgi:hypothetical protein
MSLRQARRPGKAWATKNIERINISHRAAWWACAVTQYQRSRAATRPPAEDTPRAGAPAPATGPARYTAWFLESADDRRPQGARGVHGRAGERARGRGARSRHQPDRHRPRRRLRGAPPAARPVPGVARRGHRVHHRPPRTSSPPPGPTRRTGHVPGDPRRRHGLREDFRSSCCHIRHMEYVRFVHERSARYDDVMECWLHGHGSRYVAGGEGVDDEAGGGGAEQLRGAVEDGGRHGNQCGRGWRSRT